MPTAWSAAEIRSSDPSIAFGDAWWSMTHVTPRFAASIAPTSAESSTSASSSARSSFHQTRARISRNVAGATCGGGMPHASDE